MTKKRATAITSLTLLLVVTAQLLDLATFGIAAHVAGPAGELGPLRSIYLAGGFAPVVLTKLLGISAVLCIFALWERLVGSARGIALLVAAVGVFGAATNLVGIVGALGVSPVGLIRL